MTIGSGGRAVRMPRCRTPGGRGDGRWRAHGRRACRGASPPAVPPTGGLRCVVPSGGRAPARRYGWPGAGRPVPGGAGRRSGAVRGQGEAPCPAPSRRAGPGPGPVAPDRSPARDRTARLCRVAFVEPRSSSRTDQDGRPGRTGAARAWCARGPRPLSWPDSPPECLPGPGSAGTVVRAAVGPPVEPAPARAAPGARPGLRLIGTGRVLRRSPGAAPAPDGSGQEALPGLGRLVLPRWHGGRRGVPGPFPGRGREPDEP